MIDGEEVEQSQKIFLDKELDLPPETPPPQRQTRLTEVFKLIDDSE